MTDAELVDEYERVASEAAKAGDVEQYNRIILGPFRSVSREIERRGEGVRRSLLGFLHHGNPRVRLLVAGECYDLAEQACGDVLRELARGGSRFPGESTHALIKLINLDKKLRARADAGDMSVFEEVLGQRP
jgi:hypothetical protein